MRVIVTGGFLRLGGQGASLGIMRRPVFHRLGGKEPPPQCAETQQTLSFKVFSRPMLPALSPLAPEPRYKLNNNMSQVEKPIFLYPFGSTVYSAHNYCSVSVIYLYIPLALSLSNGEIFQ